MPNRLMSQDNRTWRIGSQHLPSPSDALILYQQNGGRIQEESTFGSDPLVLDASKAQIRESSFKQMYPTLDPIFHRLVNNDV